MSCSLLAVSYDAADPEAIANFWGELLGRPVVDDGGGLLLPGDATQVGLRFERQAAPRSGPDRIHLHLTSSSLDDQQQTVEAIVSLGGRHIDVGQLPEEDHIVLADPDGNELCVIGPDNNFLRGCGYLGEVACEGSREVGLFWRDALEWPLVWDQDGETAVQAPEGGTKVAWAGPPVAPQRGRNRQRFHLTTDGVAGETERLVGLGATRLQQDSDSAEGVELRDPDGNEFVVVRR